MRRIYLLVFVVPISVIGACISSGTNPGEVPGGDSSNRVSHVGGGDPEVIWVSPSVVNLVTAETVWTVSSAKEQGPFTALVHSNAIVVQRSDGGLVCKELRTGIVLWKHAGLVQSDMTNEGVLWSPTLAIREGTLVQAAQQRLRAIDVSSGKQLWSSHFEGTAAGVRRRVLFLPEGILLLSNNSTDFYSRERGVREWSQKYAVGAKELEPSQVLLALSDKLMIGDLSQKPPTWRILDSPATFGKSLHLAGTWASIGRKEAQDSFSTAVYDLQGGDLWWKGTFSPTGLFGPINGLLYVSEFDLGTATGSLSAIAVDTKKVVWRYPLKWRGIAVLFSQEHVYLCQYTPVSTMASLKSLNARTGQLHWSSDDVIVPRSHSVYSQSVRLLGVDRRIALISEQSYDSYVKVFNKADGAVLKSWSTGLPPRSVPSER